MGVRRAMRPGLPNRRQMCARDEPGAQCAGHHAGVRGLQRTKAGVAGQERRCACTARLSGETPTRGALRCVEGLPQTHLPR